jgi:hypothetical protein
VQIGSLEILLRQHVSGHGLGMIVQPGVHFLQFACP